MVRGSAAASKPPQQSKGGFVIPPFLTRALLRCSILTGREGEGQKKKATKGERGTKREEIEHAARVTER